jgi:L,D-transpeptidase YcbB
MRLLRKTILPVLAGLCLAQTVPLSPARAQTQAIQPQGQFGAATVPAGGFTSAHPPAPANGKPVAVVAPKPTKAKVRKPAAPVVHERVVARNDKRPSFHPESLGAINAAAQKYLAIANAGDWPILPATATLRPGSEGDLVLVLRQRLVAEGDLAAEDVVNPVFDGGLASAVKRFQARHGQSQNALVQGPTLAALRVSARDRHHQLSESARRLGLRSFGFGTRYVVVNIPSAAVEAIRDGEVERRFIAVVGKKERASPEVETRITNVNFNPTWTVPISIVKKDIIPKMRKDASYLAKAKIRIYGSGGNEVDPKAIDWTTERAAAFTLRQESGKANALGQLRIDMPNRESVYMHDTPSKRLFARDDRFHSSGCVRVENVRDLAAWVLEGARGWDREAIDAAIKAGERKDIRPREPIPVIWTYLTGYVTPDGTVHFRPDVYGLDSGAVMTASGETAPSKKAQKAPMPLDSAGLDARAAAASTTSASIYSTANIPVQRIDP